MNRQKGEVTFFILVKNHLRMQLEFSVIPSKSVLFLSLGIEYIWITISIAYIYKGPI